MRARVVNILHDQRRISDIPFGTGFPLAVRKYDIRGANLGWSGSGWVGILVAEKRLLIVDRVLALG